MHDLALRHCPYLCTRRNMDCDICTYNLHTIYWWAHVYCRKTTWIPSYYNGKKTDVNYPMLRLNNEPSKLVTAYCPNMSFQTKKQLKKPQLWDRILVISIVFNCLVTKLPLLHVTHSRPHSTLSMRVMRKAFVRALGFRRHNCYKYC